MLKAIIEKAQERLAIIVAISLVLILVLLYGLFNSLRDSLLALAGTEAMHDAGTEGFAPVE